MDLQQKKSHLDRIDKLQEENNMLRKLATKRGFIQLYYSYLKDFNTNTECFDFLNEKHKKEFGKYKFSGYDSFRVIRNREL